MFEDPLDVSYLWDYFQRPPFNWREQYYAAQVEVETYACPDADREDVDSSGGQNPVLQGD